MRLLVVILVTALAQFMSAARPHRNCLLWDLDELDSNSSPTTTWSFRKAVEFLAVAPVSVAQKELTVTGEPHDYESLATYAWPDPNNPEGPYITRDGSTNPEAYKYCWKLLQTLSDRLIKFSRAYYMTGETRFAEACRQQLYAWFIDQDSYMIPSFKYGQFIPGRNDGLGYPGAAAEAYYLVDVVECIELLKENGELDEEMDRQLRWWFQDMANWLYTSEQGRRMGQVRDNIGVMYDILLYRICRYTGQQDICNDISRNFTTRRLNQHIQRDGSQPQELKRTQAFMYSAYNLEHFVDFCVMLERSGVRYYKQNRKRIDAAFRFIELYAKDRVSGAYKESEKNWDRIDERMTQLHKRIDGIKNYQ